MKLSSIKEEHIIEAGKFIDHDGITDLRLLKNLYWVELPNGRRYPFKYLTRIAYQMVKGQKNQWLNFQSKPEYRTFIESLGFKIIYYKEQLSFFEGQELSFFKTIAGKKYRKADNNLVRKGRLLVPLVRKINLWADHSCVEDFHPQVDNHWQWSGNYKSYLWVRLRRENSNPNVFFIVGCGGHGKLFIKIDCQRSNHSKGSTKPLTSKLVSEFDKYINDVSTYSEQSISINELEKYNWDKLIERTQNFLLDYATLYDELVQLVDGENFTNKTEQVPEGLTESEPPLSTHSYANKQRSFKGSNIDWSRKQDSSSKLGTDGENLVIKHEQEKLKKVGFYELAEKVEKRLDGEGYDIRSFDLMKNEIHIEVKTTKKNIEEPFYMSLNEMMYFKENPQHYYLYRLYNFNHRNKQANFFKMNATELGKITFLPTNFELSINT